MISVEMRETVADLRRYLEIRAMPQAKQRAALRSVCKYAKTDARHNTAAQRDIHGHAFAPRAEGRKKLLKNIAKSSNLSVRITGEKAVVKYKARKLGKIAYAQQYGESSTYTAQAYARRQSERPDDSTRHYDEPITRPQARRLIGAGYKVSKPGSRIKKRPTIKWLVESGMTRRRFGFIYRELTGPTKSSWSVTIPARPFLGLSKAQVKQRLIEELFEN